MSEYDEQRKDMSSMYNRITLNQLQKMAPSVSVFHALVRRFTRKKKVRHKNVPEDPEVLRLCNNNGLDDLPLHGEIKKLLDLRADPFLAAQIRCLKHRT